MNGHAYTEAIRGTIEVLAILLQDVNDDEQVSWIEYLEYLLGKREDEFDEYSHVDEWGDEEDVGF